MKQQERKRVIEMERVMSVNSWISSLPRVVEKKIWKVTDTNGTVVQYCSASDNLKRTAQKYIDGKYPGRTLKLTFVGCRGYITIPR